MKKLMLAIAAVTLLVVPATATVLWDQYAPAPGIGAISHGETGCGFFGYTNFLASDVSFDDNVKITTVTTVFDYYASSPDQNLVDLCTEAYLMVVPKTGNLVWPADDPRIYPTVPVTVNVVNIDGTDCQELVASGLDVQLYAGDYWVVFTPIVPGAASGLSNQHYITSAVVGDAMMYADACTDGPWFTSMDALGADVDMTLKLDGEYIAVSTEDSSWGQLKALYR